MPSPGCCALLKCRGFLSAAPGRWKAHRRYCEALSVRSLPSSPQGDMGGSRESLLPLNKIRYSPLVSYTNTAAYLRVSGTSSPQPSVRLTLYHPPRPAHNPEHTILQLSPPDSRPGTTITRTAPYRPIRNLASSILEHLRPATHL